MWSIWILSQGYLVLVENITPFWWQLIRWLSLLAFWRSILQIPQRTMSSFRLMKSWVSMGFLCLLYHIEVLSLPQISGGHFRRVLVLKLTLAQNYIHWQINRQNLPFRPYKICWQILIDFMGIWDDYLPLIEFAYNNSYHSNIQMAPYEALYRSICRSPILVWSRWNNFDMARFSLLCYG